MAGGSRTNIDIKQNKLVRMSKNEDDEDDKSVGGYSDSNASGHDNSASNVKKLLRASSVAVKEEITKTSSNINRPTTAGGALVQTALNAHHCRDIQSIGYKQSAEHIAHLQRAARYRLRIDPCKQTGLIIPPLTRSNTDKSATIIFPKSASRIIKRLSRQHLIDEQNQQATGEQTSNDDGGNASRTTIAKRTAADKNQAEEDEPLAAPPLQVDHVNQSLYKSACKQLGVVPAKFFHKHLITEAIIMKHHILGPLGTKACCIALANNAFVKQLDLQDNSIGSEGACFLAEMMQENIHISDLTIAENNIGAEGLRALSDVLKSHLSIVRLDLSGNNLNDFDIKPIIEIIESNSSLRHLVLRHNKLANKAAIAFSSCLAKNTTLEILDLGWNQINGRGAVVFCDGITKNKTLTNLNLEWNGLAIDGSKAMAKTLKLNKTLCSLDISYNRINIVALDHLLKGLRFNSSLQSLCMRGNPLTIGGTRLILQTLQQNSNIPLQHLDIVGQCVDEEFMKELEKLRQLKANMNVIHSYVLKQDSRYKTNEDHFPDDNPITVLLEYVRLKCCQPQDLFPITEAQTPISYDDFRRALKANNVPLTMAAVHKMTKALDTENKGFIDVRKLQSGLKEHNKRVKLKKQDTSTAFEKTPLGRISDKLLNLLPELQAIQDRENALINEANKKQKKNWLDRFLDDNDEDASVLNQNENVS